MPVPAEVLGVVEVPNEDPDDEPDEELDGELDEVPDEDPDDEPDEELDEELDELLSVPLVELRLVELPLVVTPDDVLLLPAREVPDEVLMSPVRDVVLEVVVELPVPGSSFSAAAEIPPTVISEQLSNGALGNPANNPSPHS